MLRKVEKRHIDVALSIIQEISEQGSESSIQEDKSLLYFLAFCLQEGELKPDSDGSDLSADFDLTEWREYIKDKYHILPPKVNSNGFMELFKRGIQVTCGIVVVNETTEVSLDDPIGTLDFSARTMNRLRLYRIDSIDKLISCYNAGLMSRICHLGTKSLKEIDETLHTLGITKVAQQTGSKLRMTEFRTFFPELYEDFE